MKAFIYCLIFLALPLVQFAQQSNDRRTLSTKIADVLARFPAPDKAQYDANVQQLQNLGEGGLKQLLGMLSATGKGDNTSLEYAIAAYSSSVMQGKQRDRSTAINIYCDALKQQEDVMNKEFIIRQLQLVGNDDALTCLQPFLNDEKLAGPAARAIAQINTEAAGKLLLQSLTDNTTKDKASVIEGLGYMRYAPAASAIQAEYANANTTLKTAVAYALAEIADPASSKILHDAAKNAKFTIENSGATDAYFKYIYQLAKKDSKLAGRLAGQLMTEADASKNVHARIAALYMAADLNGNKSQPLLVKAMRDDNNEYRAAALKIAGRFRNNASNKQWLSLLNNASAGAKSQIIDYLGNSGDEALAGTIDDYVFDGDDDVRKSALIAVTKLQQEKALPIVFNVLKKGNAEDVNNAKSALLQIKTDNIGSKIAAHLDSLSPAGSVAALDVIAARRAEDASAKVFALTAAPNQSVRDAAFKALPQVVNDKDMPRLFTMMKNTSGKELNFVQDAITAASAGITDTANRTKAITSEMSNAAAGTKHLFVPTLAAIGGRDALAAVDEVYNSGNQEAKRTAIESLSKNKDARSASMLLKIAQTASENKDAAVNGYISIIQRGSFPVEQKVVMLQQAMELATKDDQRKRIIQLAGRNPTWISLMFAGEYLNNASLRTDAGFAVMNIALANPELRGQRVRTLLQDASKLLTGGDSEYQREAIRKHLADMPAGESFVPMFNGKDLTGWKGLVDDPIKRSKMTPKALAAAQAKANVKMKEGWQAKDGMLVFTGHGDNLATEKQYGDFEMLVDWKITPEGDAGLYLRGTPQVQIWDTSRRDVGAEVGSGGLYNNQKHPSKPLTVADNPVGEWNNFRIIMKDDKVTVYLNGVLVTDNVVLENYWDRTKPLLEKEQIELQAHGTLVAYRNLYIRELTGSKPFSLSDEEKKENFKVLFDGTNLNEWVGNKKDYIIENNELVIKPSEGGGGGNLFTKDEYADFNFRFEFMLTPGANNGLGIRAPLDGDAAYTGMELQILDNEADIYKDLKPYQYHGSVYGVITAKRGFLKPIGEWNYQEVIAKGSKIKVILNGTVILDGDLKEAREKGTLDKLDHPGIKRDKGHIGFLGHGSVLKFRNIRVKEL